MSVKRRQIDIPPGTDEIVDASRLVSAKRSPSTSAISEAAASDVCESHSSSSHPGLLALARVLGRHAARADLRRARRGAVPLMVVTDWLLVTDALILGALVWSVMAWFR